MFLREMLTESDIPHRDKMRESIITASLESSEALYLDLAVSFMFSSAMYLLLNSVPAGESVSLQTFGQMQIWRLLSPDRTLDLQRVGWMPFTKSQPYWVSLHQQEKNWPEPCNCYTLFT